VHLLTWPKTRRLAYLTATVSPGRLLLTAADGSVVLDAQDPDELRSFAMQVHAAAVDRDLEVQAAAAKASADRRLRRQQRGEPTGYRHGPFTDVPEPPMHMEVPA
jgi:hypothetical protein